MMMGINQHNGGNNGNRRENYKGLGYLGRVPYPDRSCGKQDTLSPANQSVPPCSHQLSRVSILLVIGMEPVRQDYQVTRVDPIP